MNKGIARETRLYIVIHFETHERPIAFSNQMTQCTSYIMWYLTKNKQEPDECNSSDFEKQREIICRHKVTDQASSVASLYVLSWTNLPMQGQGSSDSLATSKACSHCTGLTSSLLSSLFSTSCNTPLLPCQATPPTSVQWANGGGEHDPLRLGPRHQSSGSHFSMSDE